MRRTTSTPRSAPPLQRPATTHSVPPRATCSSGQRSRSAPPQLPGSTSASTTPPCWDTASKRRTIAARAPRPPSPVSRPHLPAQVASRSRPAAAPQSVPATPMTPTAAPSGARRASHRAAPSTGATAYSAPRTANRSRPAARPTPNATVRKRMGGRIPGGGRLSSLHQLYGPRATAGREPHLAEPLEQSHVELGLLLIAVEPQLHQHLALGRGHVARRQPVERVHEHVAAARLAAAEPGQLGTELAVLPLHHLERQVRHPTTASPPVWSTGRAAKVEPVVPVKRTVRYDPIHWSGPGNRATLFARVRPWSRSPRLAHPSTRTSCVLPTSATFLRRAIPRTAATSRSRRSLATGSGTP